MGCGKARARFHWRGAKMSVRKKTRQTPGLFQFLVLCTVRRLRAQSPFKVWWRGDAHVVNGLDFLCVHMCGPFYVKNRTVESVVGRHHAFKTQTRQLRSIVTSQEGRCTVPFNNDGDSPLFTRQSRIAVCQGSYSRELTRRRENTRHRHSGQGYCDSERSSQRCRGLCAGTRRQRSCSIRVQDVFSKGR